MILVNKLREIINPATEDTLKRIEAKINTGATDTSIQALAEAITDGDQVTQVVNETGTPIALATSTKQSDGSQKTQVVNSGGTNVDFATAAKQTDGSQKAQNVDAGGISAEPIFRVFSLTVTRPANTDPYAAGDVIGDVGAALYKFVNVAKANGYGLVISNIRLQTNDTGLAGKVINMHFYCDTVDAIADNAAFALADANVAKRRGMIQVTFGTGTLAKVAQAQFENLIVVPVARDISLIMETVAAFTPSANSTWIRAEIGCILGN